MMVVNKVSGDLTGAAGSPISPLVVEVTQETDDRLHIKTYDPNNKRWEVPTRYLNRGARLGLCRFYFREMVSIAK